MADSEVVITDTDGKEHVFPAGFDRSRAAAIVRARGLSTVSSEAPTVGAHPEAKMSAEPPGFGERMLSATGPAIRGVGDVTGVNRILEGMGAVDPGRLTGDEDNPRDASTRTAAAVGGGGVMGASAVSGLVNLARTGGVPAVMKGVAALTVVPAVKYELTKQALEALHFPAVAAIPIAIAVSGYHKGKVIAPTAAAEAAAAAAAETAVPAAAETPLDLTRRVRAEYRAANPAPTGGAAPPASPSPVAPAAAAAPPAAAPVAPEAPPMPAAQSAPAAAPAPVPATPAAAPMSRPAAMSAALKAFLDAKETPLTAEVSMVASRLQHGGVTPEQALKVVLGNRAPMTHAEALAAKLGTPNDAAVTADMRNRYQRGQKSLSAYGKD